jgi:hypothetical protein
MQHRLPKRDYWQACLLYAVLLREASRSLHWAKPSDVIRVEGWGKDGKRLNIYLSTVKLSMEVCQKVG